MDRRIFGIENEYGVTCTFQGQRRLSPGRGRPLPVPQGRVLGPAAATSSCATAPGSTSTWAATRSTPPPSATTSSTWSPTTRRGSGSSRGCSSTPSGGCATRASTGDVYLFKNNTDSAGNSYGCHENYLVGRHGEFAKLADVLIPFLVTRQIIVRRRQGHPDPARRDVLRLASAPSTSGRASRSATTRSRPIINTRDEPHADAERYRRLHVIVGDSNMSRDHHAAQGGHLRPGAADDRGGRGDARPHDGEPDPRDPRDLPRHDRAPQGPAGQRPRGQRAGDPGRVPHPGPRLRRPPRAAHAGHRPGPRPVGARPQGGRVRRPRAGRARDRLGHQVEADRALPRPARAAARATPGSPSSTSPTTTSTAAAGSTTCSRSAARSPGSPTTCAIFEAKSRPPQTTRARLRGEFIKRAQERRRDFTVDWVHLKLNDQAQRTVLCKDPFRAHDERVQQAHRRHVNSVSG